MVKKRTFAADRISLDAPAYIGVFLYDECEPLALFQSIDQARLWSGKHVSGETPVRLEMVHVTGLAGPGWTWYWTGLPPETPPLSEKTSEEKPHGA